MPEILVTRVLKTVDFHSLQPGDVISDTNHNELTKVESREDYPEVVTFVVRDRAGWFTHRIHLSKHPNKPVLVQAHVRSDA